MKTLLILRHAKSSWSHKGLSDHDRPLNSRGERDAPRMGQLLKQEELLPDLIISSTAVRAKITAELVAEACDYEGEIWTTREFYLADPESFVETLQTKVPETHEIVMVVGHNPGMEELVDELSGVQERITTANIAHITLPISAWSELDRDVAGKLENLWRPKEL